MTGIQLPRDRHWRRTTQLGLFVQLLAIFLLCLYSIRSQRFLFADGAYHLWQFFRFERLFEWFPARRFSHLLTQLPTYLAIRAFGVRDLNCLAALYGGTWFFVPILGLLVGLWAGRHASINHRLPPLLCIVILLWTNSLIIFHESWITVSLFWIELDLLLHSRKLTGGRATVLLSAAVLMTRTYESYLFLAIPLAAAAIYRLQAARQNRRSFEALVAMVCVAIAVVGAALALKELIHPFDAGNRQTFILAVWKHFEYRPVPATFFGMLLFLAISMLKSAHRRLAWTLTLLTAVVLVVIGVFPWFDSCAIEPQRQYDARVQFLYVPFLLGCSAIFFAWKGSQPDASNSAERPELWVLAATMTFSAVAFQLAATREWNAFLASIKADASQHRGIIPFADSTLARSVAEERSSSGRRSCRDQFQWSWTAPTLSALVGAMENGHVSTIIENAGPISWEPFDPRDLSAISWLKAYGISIDLPETPPPETILTN